MTNDQDRPASQSETGPVRPPMAGQADGNDATPDSQANVRAQHGQTGLLMELMRETYGADAALWRRRWRRFYLATAGLFGNDGGNTWAVNHYLLKPA